MARNHHCFSSPVVSCVCISGGRPFKDQMNDDHAVHVNTLSCEYADDVTCVLSTQDEDHMEAAVDIMMGAYSQYFSSRVWH